jgi:hypothetical protein
MLRIRIAKWLTLVIVWGAACDAHSAENIRKMEFETEVATIVIPDGYEIGHEQSGVPGIIEMIPHGQKIKRWRDIYTIGILPHSPEAPEVIRKRAQSEFIKTCGGKYMTGDKNIEHHQGADATMWMQVCEKHKSGPSMGKYEFDLFILMKGSEVDLLLMRGFRYEASTELGRWMDFLQKSTLRPK